MSFANVGYSGYSGRRKPLCPCTANHPEICQHIVSCPMPGPSLQSTSAPFSLWRFDLERAQGHPVCLLRRLRFESESCPHRFSPSYNQSTRYGDSLPLINSVCGLGPRFQEGWNTAGLSPLGMRVAALVPFFPHECFGRPLLQACASGGCWTKNKPGFCLFPSPKPLGNSSIYLTPKRVYLCSVTSLSYRSRFQEVLCVLKPTASLPFPSQQLRCLMRLLTYPVPRRSGM